MALHHGAIALAASLLLSVPSLATGARLRLSNTFGDGMVLQRDVPTAVWGWSAASATVYGALKNTATNATQRVQIAADAAGLFNLPFAPTPGGLQGYTVVVSTAPVTDMCILFAFHCDGATLQLSGLMFGDVILCTGQSNMQVNVAFAFNASEELIAANAYGGFVRVYQTLASVSSKVGPLDDIAQVQIPWSAAGSYSLPSFSATCWYTGKSIVDGRPAQEREMPLGLVVSTWGGTPIKAWTSAAVGAQCAALYPYPPGTPSGDCGMFHAPCNQSVLYDALLAPLAVGPMRVSSIVWFQGENDAGGAELANGPFAFYACQLRAMAGDMRASFASPAAHWTTIQLAPYLGGAALGPFRDMQCRATAAIANASCAVIDDGGDPLSPIGSVHSRNKQLVGRRVAAGLIPALYASAPANQAIGPTYASATLALAPDGLTALANVSFAPGSLGPAGSDAAVLVYVPPHVDAWQNSSRCPTEIGGVRAADCDWLYILGSDGVAYNASSAQAIEAGTVLALQAPVPAGVRPVGTRFGYNAWPVVNFYNGAGFPMVPWNATAV